MKMKMMSCLVRLFSREGRKSANVVHPKPAGVFVYAEVEKAKSLLNNYGYDVTRREDAVKMKLKNTSSMLKSFARGHCFFSFSMRRKVMEAAAVIFAEERKYKAEMDSYDIVAVLKEREASYKAEKDEERESK